MRYTAIMNVHTDVVVINGEADARDSNGNQVTLDEPAIAIELSRLQAEFDSQEYARNRAEQYPDYAEQLDLLFHDMTSGKGDKTGEWYKAVNKVKTDNPKG